MTKKGGWENANKDNNMKNKKNKTDNKKNKKNKKNNKKKKNIIIIRRIMRRRRSQLGGYLEVCRQGIQPGRASVRNSFLNITLLGRHSFVSSFWLGHGAAQPMLRPDPGFARRDSPPPSSLWHGVFG